MTPELAAQVEDLGLRFFAYKKARSAPRSAIQYGAILNTCQRFHENVHYYAEKHGELPTGVFTFYRWPNLAPFCAKLGEVDLHDLSAPSSAG